MEMVRIYMISRACVDRWTVRLTLFSRKCFNACGHMPILKLDVQLGFFETRRLGGGNDKPLVLQAKFDELLEHARRRLLSQSKGEGNVGNSWTLL